MKNYTLLNLYFCLILLCINIAPVLAKATPDSTAIKIKAAFKGKLIFSGFSEAYYGYDFGKPQSGNRPDFIYSHNRHDEVNLNLIYAKLNYSASHLRTNLALMYGTYANANLAAEPFPLRYIFEANIGFRLSKKKELWLDGGIFPSHIGFESAISKDCWTLTRSIMAENTPYFETGAKLSYTSDNGKLFASVLLLNGWQRIQRIKGNSLPSFGWQITYKPNTIFSLNSSTFFGANQPDAERKMRYYHNFYGIIQPIDQFGITVGMDFGAEQKNVASKHYNLWYSPAVIMRYVPTAKVAIVARYEYYNDAAGVVIATATPNGFQTHGVSANLDVNILKNLLWRIEGKGYFSKDKVFQFREKLSSKNYAITTSLAMSF
ncbi:MAG: porin [Chitinophagales bacterium]|nr:porin [Chitinophagales bacterium]